MASTFTTNKHIEKPASGDYNNAWATPVNADWDDIDNALGGHAGISVTGVGAGTYALTLPQYQPPIIAFTGVLTANLVYALPAGVGGLWSISNGTTGAFSLTFGVSGGGTLVLVQGQRSFVYSDGSAVGYADQAYASAQAASAQSAAIAAAAASAAALYGPSINSTFTSAGFSGLPNVTVHYTVLGNQCTLFLAGATTMLGTITNGSIGFSGAPSACWPATARTIPCFVENNGVNNLFGAANIGTNGTVNLSRCTSQTNGLELQGFTTGATGGLTAGWSITYPLT
jgi:hypothetical protein